MVYILQAIRAKLLLDLLQNDMFSSYHRHNALLVYDLL